MDLYYIYVSYSPNDDGNIEHGYLASINGSYARVVASKRDAKIYSSKEEALTVSRTIGQGGSVWREVDHPHGILITASIAKADN